jgi:hypothetical protein
MSSYNLRKRQPKQQLLETSNLKKRKLNPKMLLENLSNEVLTEMASNNLRKRQPKLLEKSKCKTQKLNPKMLEDCSNEVLTDILSFLSQKDLLLSVALVSKRFRDLTKSRQLSKRVVFYNFTKKTEQQINSFMDMLSTNKHLEKLVLNCSGILGTKIVQIVSQHGYLRHLVLTQGKIIENDQEDWQEALSKICPKLKVLDISYLSYPQYCLAPLVNAKWLTTLKLSRLPTSATFRQMADNCVCLQTLHLHGLIDCSENSDMAYFLDKQSKTLTSLTISTNTEKPLIAISKCQNLMNLDLKVDRFIIIDMTGLGYLSKLRCLSLGCMDNIDLGHCIKAAQLPHLNEIKFYYVDRLDDNAVCLIAQTYGQQVTGKITTICLRKQVCSLKSPAGFENL